MPVVETLNKPIRLTAGAADESIIGPAEFGCVDLRVDRALEQLLDKGRDLRGGLAFCAQGL